MGIPVVVSTNGYGLPVKAVSSNAPVMTVASNGYGTPIVLSDFGVPFVVQDGGGVINTISLRDSSSITLRDSTPLLGRAA